MERGTSAASGSRPQFGLKALFEFMTICCVLAAFSGVLGVGSAASLMAFSVAIAARQGIVALASLIAASLVAGIGIGDIRDLGAQLATVVAAGTICGWYQLRIARKWAAESLRRPVLQMDAQFELLARQGPGEPTLLRDGDWWVR